MASVKTHRAEPSVGEKLPMKELPSTSASVLHQRKQVTTTKMHSDHKDKNNNTAQNNIELRYNSSNNSKSNDDLFVIIWIAFISAFIVLSMLYPQMGPVWLSKIWTPPIITLIHHISNMIFSGSIMTASILEWIIMDNYNNLPHVCQFWFMQVPSIEQVVVLPALALSIVTGICKSFIKYGSIKNSPIHIQYTLFIMTLFGVWWGITDKTTQGPARTIITKIVTTITSKHNDTNHHHNAVSNDSSSSTKEPSCYPLVFRIRKLSNTISCMFLFTLYGIMTLKPGYNQEK